MKYYEIIQMYKEVLSERKIPFSIEPWGDIIIEFAKGNQNTGPITLREKVIKSVEKELKKLENPSAYLSREQKNRLGKELIRTKKGEMTLEDFLATVNSNSSVDDYAYFSLVGIVKELLINGT